AEHSPITNHLAVLCRLQNGRGGLYGSCPSSAFLGFLPGAARQLCGQRTHEPNYSRAARSARMEGKTCWSQRAQHCGNICSYASCSPKVAAAFRSPYRATCEARRKTLHAPRGTSCARLQWSELQGVA